MIRIVLPCGRVTVVDGDTPDHVLNVSWRAMKQKDGRLYVISNIRLEDGRRSTAYLHRAVVGAGRGQRVDHIDGDGLNNQRSNLRVCSNAENIRNSGINSRNTSGFKGVARRGRGEKPAWEARIMVNGKTLRMGPFATKRAAAEAYDAAAIRLHGDFARTNRAMGLLD